jgi:chromosome segregation ATPase
VSLSEARAAAAAEAASLRSELETVRKERARQSGVIEALMRRSEELCADAGRARELEASNEALARGLEAQGGTLDRLLALNEELAGVANALSAAREAGGGAPAGEAPAGAAPEALYDEEWELEEAEARARGEPPPKGWLMRAWGAATTEQPSGAADAGEAKAAPAAEADAV